MKTAHQNAPTPQQGQDVANKSYVDSNRVGFTTEHLATASNAVALSPTVNESFVALGAGSNGTQAGSLADGTTDGFVKIIRYIGGSGLRLSVTPVHGPQTVLAASGGAAIYVWDATDSQWQLISGLSFVQELILSGSTPGSSSGESVELKFGTNVDQMLLLEDSKAYTLVVSGVAKGQVSASASMQSFRQTFAVRRASGLTTISGFGALEQLGDTASGSWTLTASVGVGPDRFALTFSTGSTTSAAKCVVRVELTEVLN